MAQHYHRGTEVVIPLDGAIEIARDLECIVVSLDRIGSRRVGGDADADTLDLFLAEWGVLQRLARARGVMWDAIATVVGEEAVEEIAEGVPRFPGEPSLAIKPDRQAGARHRPD